MNVNVLQSFIVYSVFFKRQIKYEMHYMYLNLSHNSLQVKPLTNLQET